MEEFYMDKNLLEITGYDGEGYVPLIDYSHWRVAELRYCEELEVDKLKDMQKHDETDEVFVLLEGDFTLFLGGNGEHIGEIEAIKLEPASSRIAPKFFITCSACSSIVEPTISPVAGSNAICPDENNVLFTTTPCEYGPIAAGAFSVLIFFMSNTSLVSKFIFSVLFYSFA